MNFQLVQQIVEFRLSQLPVLIFVGLLEGFQGRKVVFFAVLDEGVKAFLVFSENGIHFFESLLYDFHFDIDFLDFFLIHMDLVLFLFQFSLCPLEFGQLLLQMNVFFRLISVLVFDYIILFYESLVLLFGNGVLLTVQQYFQLRGCPLLPLN